TAAAAGTVAVNGPSPIRTRSKVKVLPSGRAWKLATSPLATTRSEATNPVTFAENTAVTGMLAALEGNVAVVVSVTVGGTPISCTSESATAPAALRLPAGSETALVPIETRMVPGEVIP